ncbi:HSP20-like chaperone [Baffinella frigidus]|nr:HSP20-like chaperone [Cryptophyta sp. CCMP2293]
MKSMKLKPVAATAFRNMHRGRGGAPLVRLARQCQPFFNMRPWASPPRALDPIFRVDPVTLAPMSRIMDDLENAIQNALVFPDELATTDRKTKGPIELGLRPSFDLRENEDGYVVSCFTPGLKKEDLHAEVVGTDAFPVLVVRGESKKEDGTPPDAKDAEDGKEKTSFFRTKYQKFEQRMSLPADVDQEKMGAKYEDGILAITLPRKPNALPTDAPQKIDIQ